MLRRSAATSAEPVNTAAPPVAASVRASLPVKASWPPAPGAPAPGAPVPDVPVPLLPPLLLGVLPAAPPALPGLKGLFALPPPGRIVEGGGLPAVVCARATLESCGATQTTAPAAMPALTPARANCLRESLPACSPSFPPRLGTPGSIASHTVCVKHESLAARRALLRPS